jgi:hypothetical protein
MGELSLGRFLLFALPIVVGIILSLALKRRSALFSSALLPWCAFLVFNLLSEFYSLDRELMNGTFWFFQATLGSFVALLGLAGCALGLGIKRWRSRNGCRTDAATSSDKVTTS